jgi:small nuclear ribonucleoprotein (snRNP)-like protein
MSLLQTKLAALVNQEIVVVMSDNRAFRGTLVAHDAESLVLRSVVEALPNNSSGWEEPTSSTGVVHKVVTWQGTFSHEDTRAEVVRLKDVIINLNGVLRIWEWNLTNLGKPDHVELADGASPRPGTRVSKRA